MEARRGVLLLSASFLVALVLDLVVACQEESRSPTKITYLCEGVEWWKMQHLFMPRITTTSCSSKVVLEYGGKSMGDLQTRGCGSYMMGIISQWTNQSIPETVHCLAESSPFETGLIVAKALSGNIENCEMESSFMFTPDRLGMFAVGLLLFFTAESLGTNSTLRIAVGTILIAALGVTMMVVWFAGRATSNQSSFSAYIVMFMATFAGTAITIFGPSWLKMSLLGNGFLVYTVVMGFIGWMVSYYYDDPNNVRRNKVYAAVARLVASAFMWYNTSDKIGGAVLVGLVWANYLLMPCTLPILSGTASIGAAAVSSIQKSYPKRGRQIERKEETRVDRRNNMHGNSKGEWCDLCKAGMIVDRRTNCKIRMPGHAFDKLVREGAVPDFVNGYV